MNHSSTVVDGVSADSILDQEESSGPVVPIMRASSDDVVPPVGRSGHELQPPVFTTSLKWDSRHTDRVCSGPATVNEPTGFCETFQSCAAAGTDTGWGRGQPAESTDLRTITVESGTPE
ncbi:MAG: hypothetical protein ACE5E8_07145 [Acidimicrobiia bacterium]